MRRIEKKHIDRGLQILASEKFMCGEVFKGDITKRKKKLAEIDYCERLLKALWEDYEVLRTQPKML